MLTLLVSCLKPAFFSRNEFRTIKSKFFLCSFFKALAFSFSVSIAKPISIWLSLFFCPNDAKISLVALSVILMLSPFFLIFCIAVCSGVKSATAAAITVISAVSNSLCTASYICAAFCTLIVWMFGWVACKCVGPKTKTTSAPRAAASSAMAIPILPLEWFPIKRTGSIDS